MQDEELKKLLLNEPTPKVSQKFQMEMCRQLNLLSIEEIIFFKSSNHLVVQGKHNYWQYLVMAVMTVVAITILTHHQQNDHIDDELTKLNPITELTLSTL